MSFDLKRLKETAEKLKKDRQASGGGIDGDWPQSTFLPDGNHKLRFLLDPDEEVYLQYNCYGYFARGIRAPEDMPEADLPSGFENELSDLAKKLGDLQKWGKTRKSVFLIYAYLYETDNKSDNWQPGNLYCLVGNWRLQDSFTDFIDTLAKDAPEEVLKTLDPKKAGRIMQVTVQGGNKGKCTIAPTFGNDAEPIKVEDFGYASLSMSYIRPGFNQEKYDALVKTYREELEKGTSEKAAYDAKKADEKPAETDKKSEVKKDEKPAEPEKKAEDKPEPAKDEPANSKPEPAAKIEEAEKPADTETPVAKEAEKVAEKAADEAEKPAEDDPWAKYKK